MIEPHEFVSKKTRAYEGWGCARCGEGGSALIHRHDRRCVRRDEHTPPGQCVLPPETHTISCTRTDAHEIPRECRFTLNDNDRRRRHVSILAIGIVVVLMIAIFAMHRSSISIAMSVTRMTPSDDVNNTTKTIIGLLSALLPLVIVLVIITTIINMILRPEGRSLFRWKSSANESSESSDPDSTIDEETKPETSEPERVKCEYCGGLFIATKLTTECPDCGAPYGESRTRLVDTRDRERALFGRSKE